MLEFYRNNLRMVPHDIQPTCQEMAVKMPDETGVPEKDSRKKFKSSEPDFSSAINKTKQQGSEEKIQRCTRDHSSFFF
jgi:hypothetical protein